MPVTAVALKVPPVREYANALPPGTMLMEYRLEQVLGAGGFGITYLGWDTHLEKHVAIKEYLPAQLAVRALDGSIVPIATEQKYDYTWGLERFVLEARTLARFSHQHIVRVNRYIEANATAYMVMDYEAGVSLSQWLGDHPQPAEDELKRIAGPILDGLEAVHAQGFLHRDIKPSNVFMRADGSPVLLDFGAARQAIGQRSMSLTSIVSPGYAPLEQYASDGNQGPWSDVYSFSAVLYRAVTGENPPEAVSRMRIDRVAAHLESAAARYSSAFLKAVALGMTVDEKMRPQSIQDWRVVLFGAGSGAQPQHGTAATTVPAIPRRNERTVLAVPAQRELRSSSATGRRARGENGSAPMRRWGWLAFGTLAVMFTGLFMRGGSNTTSPAPSASATRTGALTSARPEGRAVAAAVPEAQPDPVRVVEPVVTPPPPSGSNPDSGETAPSRAHSELPAMAIPHPVATNPSAIASREGSWAEPVAAGSRADGANASPRQKPLPPKGTAGAMRDFEWADANGDGAISLAEANDRMPRLARDFARVDANGDGMVTPPELQRFLRAVPARPPRP
jgi:serine/threonine protein kinase